MVKGVHCADFLHNPGFLGLVDTLDGEVMNGLLFATLVHHRVLALADLLIYAATRTGSVAPRLMVDHS